jgi:hypothetical protein
MDSTKLMVFLSLYQAAYTTLSYLRMTLLNLLIIFEYQRLGIRRLWYSLHETSGEPV